MAAIQRYLGFIPFFRIPGPEPTYPGGNDSAGGGRARRRRRRRR
ncbi:unnamed protein product [[Actinomadura] parvosata subsp. kistnae]|nr:unnamed protein product [Actinomadura parvosata subsp. kistnae]